MLKTCPDPIDVDEIQFKLQCSLKIFDNTNIETFDSSYNLLSCASRYGLLFVGSTTNCFKVIQLKIVEDYKDKGISNFPRRIISLPSPPRHICINCDSTILAVVIRRDDCPVAIFYDVLSFYKLNISVIKEVRLSTTPGTFVREVNWNPAIPGIFTACKSDGTLGIYELNGNSIDIKELPAAAESTSFSWSPKGKQIAVGSKNGNITQYKPDLKAVKVTNAPIFDQPHSLISLCWVSNYQFIGIYLSADKNWIKLVVVDTPKTGDITYTNYDDVCYSGSVRFPQFYLILLQQWNMLLVSSSNAMEVGVLGATSEVWSQWNVPDYGRAELLLSEDHEETLPLGITLDIGNTKPLPWGEGMRPPCPYLILLSHHGLIYFYNIVNLKEGLPSINCPPDNVADTSGLAQFILENQQIEVKAAPPQPQLAFSFTPTSSTSVSLPSDTAKISSQTTFNFGNSTTAQPTSIFVTSQASAAPAFKNEVTTTPVKPQPLPTSLFGIPQSSVAPVFGNEITITPVKPQPQSVTPIFEAPTTLTPSKPQLQTDNTEKYATIFAALKAPSATSTSVESKPIIIATKQEVQPSTPKLETPKNVPKIAQSVIVPEVSKSETSKSVLETPKSVMDPRIALDEKVKVETQALLTKMIREECISLESELKALLHQGRKINIDIGSDEEKTAMLNDFRDMQEFVNEIVDVSLGEDAEVHSLKQNLILSWAWYEEARSRYNISKDETMSLILKSQPLDSATEKRRSDIRKIIYYLDSQISQASKALDDQWDTFQDYARKHCQVKMPTMEAIFQSMVKQSVILQKQSYILKDINSRLRHRKVSANTPSLFVGINTNCIEEDLRRLQLDPDDGHRVIYEKTVERTNKLSVSKVKKLRELLKAREVVHVTAVKPSLNTSLGQSPAGKNRSMFSILGAQMSPVAKPAIVRNLQFSESTPLKVALDIRPTTVPPNTPVQPDPSKTFTFKSLDKLPQPSGTFQPLPKSASIFPSSSAFVVTSKNFTPSASSLGSPSVQTLSQFTFDSTGVGKKLDLVSSSTTSVSSTKSLFTFGTPSTITDTNSTTPSSLFSFGKTPVTVTPFGVNLKSAPTVVASTTGTSFATAGFQPTFTFGKGTDTPTKISFSKPILPSSVPNSTVSTKSATFTSTASSSASTKVSKDATITSETTSNLGSLISNSFSTDKPLLSTDSTTSSVVTRAVSSEYVPSTISIQSTAASKTVFGSTTSLFAPSTTGTASEASDNAIFDVAPLGTTANIFSSTTPIAVSTKAQTATPSVISSSAGTVSNSSEASIKTLFGTVPPSTTPAVFSSPPTGASSTSIFVTVPLGTAPFIFSSSVLTSVSSSSEASTRSIFSAVPISSSSPIISSGTSTVVSSSSEASSKSIFGAVPVGSGPSIFSSSTPTSVTSLSESTSTSKSIVPLSIASPVLSTVASTVVSSSSGAFGKPLFGAVPLSAASSVFSSAVSTTTSATTDISKTSSSFSPAQSSSGTNTATSTKSGIFSNPVMTSQVSSASAITSSSILGTAAVTTLFSSSASTVHSSPFTNTTTTTKTPFGNTTTTTQSSPFANIANAPAVTGTTQASIFGGAASISPFGAPLVTTQSSSFGGTTKSSVFGGSTTTQSSVFVSPATTAASIFGTPTTTPSTFGTIPSSASPFTTQASIFGNSAGTQPSNIFGGQSGGSIFSGTPAFGTANPSSSQGSIFAQPSSPSSTSIFGTPNSASSGFVQTTGSLFGSNFAETTTTTPAFGQSAAFGSSPGSVFGTPTTSSSVFGSGGNAFGIMSTSSNAFGSTGSSNLFSFAPAANSTSGSFNFGNLNVGTAASTTSSIFGANPTSFGQASQNPFARQTNLETPVSTSGSIFGGSSTFGGTQSTFDTSGGFGNQTAFGQSNFGQPSTFGSLQQGPFSAGVGVVQTGFGSPGAFQKTGGFGASPVFGGSPQPASAFGASPTFGAAPAFGNAATFGSPTKVFGSSMPAAGFGTASSENTGFGNLATQNTVDFGNLAQQATKPASAPFSGSSSFSSWR